MATTSVNGPARTVHPRTAATDWLHEHDPGYGALRRAVRAALILPAMFALGDVVIGNPILATFAAFGSFAMLLLVDYGGTIRDRVLAQAALGVTCAGLICGGTLCSQRTWLAVVGMAVVAFAVVLRRGDQLRARRRHDLPALGLHPARLLLGADLIDSRSRRWLGPGGDGVTAGDLAAVALAGA